ncbi:class I SAM-dependent methyltransferase [Leptolyngbya sp. CCY15150]|uniref:class I SAM-dependent methyltransferase n=1 Tax=Leptolyngbya sp. CCY15150 TaxID=2767772 RepID=UPI00194ED0BD|nr:class I SAM-dependent methyltransferase [Leptolyngbya sp. CCY15150]
MLSLLLSDSTYASFLDSVTETCPTGIMRSLNEHILFPLRRHYLTQILAAHFQDQQSVLDLGASNGILAARLQKSLAKRHQTIDMIGCDVHVPSKTYIPVVQYDGQQVPFADNTFDVVLMTDMLHHTHNPLQMLQEAKRVSRQYILIKDHYWKSPKDFTRLKFADYIGNEPYGIHLPYNFLSQTDWTHLIEQQCGLSIEHQRTFRFNLVDPCKHILFLLKLK